MFSYFGKRVQDMAFAPNKTLHARAAAALYAEETLSAYLQGRERLYAVHDVLNELRALFHSGADLPASLIRQAIETPDEEKRAVLIYKALDLIGVGSGWGRNDTLSVSANHRRWV